MTPLVSYLLGLLTIPAVALIGFVAWHIKEWVVDFQLKREMLRAMDAKKLKLVASAAFPNHKVEHDG
jgi:hypothetical protein